MTTQPEALRLADALDEWCGPGRWTKPRYAAAELRRLHALNAELLEALKLAQSIIGHPEDAHSSSLPPPSPKRKEDRHDHMAQRPAA